MQQIIKQPLAVRESEYLVEGVAFTPDTALGVGVDIAPADLVNPAYRLAVFIETNDGAGWQGFVSFQWAGHAENTEAPNVRAHWRKGTARVRVSVLKSPSLTGTLYGWVQTEEPARVVDWRK